MKKRKKESRIIKGLARVGGSKTGHAVGIIGSAGIGASVGGPIGTGIGAGIGYGIMSYKRKKRK